MYIYIYIYIYLEYRDLLGPGPLLLLAGREADKDLLFIGLYRDYIIGLYRVIGIIGIMAKENAEGAAAVELEACWAAPLPVRKTVAMLVLAR